MRDTENVRSFVETNYLINNNLIRILALTPANNATTIIMDDDVAE